MAVIEATTVLLKNGREVCIRTPAAEDAEKVLEYTKTIFSDDRFFLTTEEEAKEWQTIEKEREHIRTFYDHPDKLFLITEADNGIVSMSHLECGWRKRIRHVSRLGISILPVWRSVGLGTAILKAIIDWAAMHPVIEKLSLEVWASNERAIGLYKKMGFSEEGRKVREIKYADGSYDDCICMVRFVE